MPPRLPLAICGTRAEARAWLASEASRRRYMLEVFLAYRSRDEATFVVPGFCIVDDRPVQFEVDRTASFERVEIDWLSGDGRLESIELPNWRERMVCPRCRLNSRQRAVAAILLDELDGRGPCDARPRIYFTEQRSALFEVARGVAALDAIGSEYLGPGVAAGSVHDGTRHEDLRALSFPDASFDQVVTCSVLEHVDGPLDAVQELARVLRPGGLLLIEVPFDPLAERNTVRASGEGAGLVHHRPPAYHADPLRAEGALVYTDFGWELVEQIRATGWFDCEVVSYWSFELGHLGASQPLLRARRTSRAMPAPDGSRATTSQT